ncbi:MAG: BatA domain-containing protein [Acidobacteria bacterium]|nr:BatA domain-containing protein [Acidobacteriota bacterium]
MGFVNPLFIIGGLTAAIPILLHLIRREHARKIEFPSLMFLRRISKRTIRYQKLRHLLLLLLRILALLLIVLAFMRPYHEQMPAAVAEGHTSSTHIILLDNSMSMGFQGRWEQAKKAAVDILGKMNLGDKCAVLEFSDKAIARSQLSTDPSDALSQVESGIPLSDRATRYEPALRAAAKLASEAGTGRRIIYLISDFQKSGYEAEEREFQLEAGMDLRPVDVGAEDFSNLTIRDVRIAEPEASAEGGVILKASVANFGSRDRRNVRGTLFVNGRHFAEKRFDTAKGASQTLEYSLPSLLAGSHSIVLEVDDPYLVRDNRFYMTFDARGKIPVIVVENPPSRGGREASFFLSKALNAGSLSPYRLNVVSPQNPLISGSLVIWNNVPGGSAAVQKRLQDFVASGGGLAVVLGDFVQAAEFNRSFGSWLPVRMLESSVARRRAGDRPAEQYSLMTDIRMDHPVFQPFNRPHSGTFSSTRFFYHAVVSAGSGAEVVAKFDSGDPALITMNFEKGRVLLFASSADDASNDFPLKAVYAPFWQQTLRYLENFREPRHWHEVGDIINARELLMEAALRQSKKNPGPDESVVILDPAKKRMALSPDPNLAVMEMAGFYEVRTMNLNASLAANIASRESDLTHGNAEEMTAGWLSTKQVTFAQEERLTPEEQDRNRHFWVFLLAGALLFLISESILSNYELRITNLALGLNNYPHLF